MKKRSIRLVVMSSASLAGSAAWAQAPAPVAAPAQADSSTAAAPGEIIVTAQKRSERLNDVGLAITAVSGDQLVSKGITNASDLVRIDPSFTYAKSSFGAPVYSIRGVGFYDTALGATPAVTLYVDQAPVPYSIMSNGIGFDLERVEVLKGPQGTLFGQNSTGGAINYIDQKPTKTFHSGFDFTFGRFNDIDTTAFVSGPLSDNLTFRLAAHTEQGDGWQRSYTRNDRLGSTDRTYGRLLLDWRPTERLTVNLNVNGGYDKSDTQAGQLIAVVSPVLAPAVEAYPLSPHNDRAADWDPNTNYAQNDTQYHAGATASYEISDSLVAKSITSYQHFKRDATNDNDGTALPVYNSTDTGFINSFYEELQLSKTGGPFTWIVGGNYGKDKVGDFLHSDLAGSQYNVLLHIASSDARGIQKIDTAAVFGHADWKLTDTLKLEGGVRYTHQTRDFAGCTYDGGDGTYAALLNSAFGLNVQPGGCGTLNTQFQPTGYVTSLKEHNISWKAGIDWKVMPRSLIYASISKGYKAGAFPTAAASTIASLYPATQESIVAYEAGFKLGLLNGVLQLDGSLFYYDYSDKQVIGLITDPTFGALNRLINIPKSKETGFELSADIHPLRDLRFSASATYLDSKIRGSFVNLDAAGVNRPLSGTAFPFAPKWNILGGAEYNHTLDSGWSLFSGADVTHRTKSYSGLGEVDLFRINPSTILDLRAGVANPGDVWRVTLWAKNVTNTYSWNNVVSPTRDTVIRYASLPRTYGFTVSWRH